MWEQVWYNSSCIMKQAMNTDSSLYSLKQAPEVGWWFADVVYYAFIAFRSSEGVVYIQCPWTKRSSDYVSSDCTITAVWLGLSPNLAIKVLQLIPFSSHFISPSGQIWPHREGCSTLHYHFLIRIYKL